MDSKIGGFVQLLGGLFHQVGFGLEKFRPRGFGATFFKYVFGPEKKAGQIWG